MTREEADAALTSAKANVVATGGFTATEEAGVKHTSVEAANNDNKVQTTALTTAVSEYKQKLADYKTQLDKYYQDVLAYAAWEKSYKEYTGGTTARLLTKGLAENATGLIYKTESDATMTVENSAGSVDYLDKTIQSGHSVDEILEQFNTSRYIPSDFSAANGTQYTINADGEYTEDVWLKMATGQTLTVTYNNLNGTSFNGTPVKKIVATYTLVETPSTDGSAIVKLYHDPTKTLFIGSQTDDTNKKLHVKMNLNFFDSESSVTPLDLSKNGSVLSISSLNHWNTELGNHIEKVGLNGNDTFKFLVHLSLYMKMVMLMQQMITNLWLTVHALTVTQQLIQQLVKLQMKVGMLLTQTEHLVRRMPTMVLLQQSSRVNQWTSS